MQGEKNLFVNNRILLSSKERKMETSRYPTFVRRIPALTSGGTRHVKLEKFMGLMLLSAAMLAVNGCYTQLSSQRVRSDVYDDEYYAEEETRDEPYWDVDEGRSNQSKETVVYHHYDHDVYVHGYAPVVLDAWWYDPYWYYASGWWWRQWDYYDPWVGFLCVLWGPRFLYELPHLRRMGLV